MFIKISLVTCVTSKNTYNNNTLIPSNTSSTRRITIQKGKTGSRIKKIVVQYT